MSWIQKLEDARRREEDLRRAAADQAVQEAIKRKRHFQDFTRTLLPPLEDSLSEIERRLGVHLLLHASETEITVSGPRSHETLPRRLGANEFSISEPSPDLSTVRVTAVLDDRIDRPGERPDDMSWEDWQGAAKVVLDTRVAVSTLKSELSILLEWLTRTELDGSPPFVPRFSSTPQFAAPAGNAIQRAATAFVCSTLGLAGCFPLSFVGIYLGWRIWGDPDASWSERLAAGLAIGMGIFALLFLTGAIIFLSLY